ncbi:MAG TPA: hypothetical protein VFS77_00295, partial [Pyrinomonadaceae bacterium]|nr:hypothetical protein [Pyrinomonadaceae bacterium]
MLLIIFFSSAGQTESTAVATIPTTCPGELLTNGDFELPLETAGGAPLNWSTSQWIHSSNLSREHGNAHSGVSSARIVAQVLNDSWFWQEVTVEPQTLYLLTGWIRTENVSGGAGANLSLIGTWSHTEGLYGTNPWTRVSLIINSGSSTKLTIGARLGYWSSTSKGTAWFDDLQLTPIKSEGNRSRWKILVLIHDRTDAVVTDSKGVRHHMVGAMTLAEVERATLAATQFVETDIPALTSGYMIPELTIRYPEHALTQLDPVGEGWSPSPANTAADRDPNFDSVIVIWDPRVIDEPGTRRWVGAAAGLATPMGRGQTYAAIIIEATGYGHRNVFKHEWGHCILSYFEAMGTTPQPTVMNHANIGQYVHWPTGNAYVWADETDANPIPNSIYNNESGFTHDYYSGTTATADQPARRLGITPEAWSLGGPVTKPSAAFPPAVLACGEDVTVRKEDNNCWSRVSLAPPTGSDGCELNFTAVATRSDGLPMNAPYPCGQTVVTWSVANGAATCEQVVTVNDLEPPIFLYSATPLIVTTGPGATSCGTVVDDTRLGIPVSTADPVILDPTGDALINDIVSTAATTDGQALTMTVTFADYVFPASSGDARGLTGYIEIDSDSNPETGVASSIDPMGLPKLNMGVEFQIDLGSESAHPGLVDITLKQGGPVKIGQVPILFSEKSFLLVVPLAMLGNG